MSSSLCGGGHRGSPVAVRTNGFLEGILRHRGAVLRTSGLLIRGSVLTMKTATSTVGGNESWRDWQETGSGDDHLFGSNEFDTLADGVVDHETSGPVPKDLQCNYKKSPSACFTRWRVNHF